MRSLALVLAAQAALGCSLYSGGDDDPSSPTADARTSPPDAAAADAAPADAGDMPDAAVADANWTAVTFEEVPFTAPEWTADGRELLLITSAAQFTSRFGVAPPAALDLATEWALFYSEGARPHPGHLARVLALETDGADRLRVTTRHRAPGNGCVTMSWSPPATTLVSFAAGSTAPAIEELATAASFDCVADGATADASCDRETLCGADLICSGLTRFASGWCRPTWMWEVASETLDMTIPDNDAGGLTRTAAISGLATVDEDVIVRVELEHPAPGELVVSITNPATNEVTFWNRESATGGTLVIHRVPVGFSGDEQVNGTWTLKVVDSAAGNSGRLLGWSLELTSRFD